MTTRFRILPYALLAVAIGVFLFLEWIGGSTYPLDVAAIRDGALWRAVHPQAEGWIILYTHLGSAPALLTMTALGAGWLWWRRERMRPSRRGLPRRRHEGICRGQAASWKLRSRELP